MRHIYSVLLGMSASVLGSYIISFLGSFIGWCHLSDGAWLVQVSLIPSGLAGVALSFTSRFRRIRFTALLVAFFAVALAGSIGAVALHASRFGLDRTNVSGYFTSCWVYAAVFLPISYPLTRLL